MTWRRAGFGARLKVARQWAGLTQLDLAMGMATSRSTISRWEAKFQPPTNRPDLLRALAGQVRVDAAWLAGHQDDPHGAGHVPPEEVLCRLLTENWVALDDVARATIEGVVRMAINSLL